MEFRILGPLEVVGPDGAVALPRGRARALLALLVLHAGEVVPTERLVDDLWGGEPPPTAVTALHGLVSSLRRRLEPDRGRREGGSLLHTRPPGYLLAVDPGDVDTNRFRRLVDEARDAMPQDRAALLDAAMRLWRGPALADFTYEPFAQAEIAMLEELRLTAIEERMDAALTLGRHRELVGELEGLVATHPYRERLRGQLMLALYRDGRQADALQAYRDGRRTLVEELGIEPGPALAGLEQAILRQDPALVTQQQLPGPEIESTPWLPPGRRTVTVVFAELAESSRTDDAADPEVVRRMTGQCYDAARRIVDHHGGVVQGLIGGVVVAVFGVPTAHEDDALRAARAALELREAAAAAGQPELGVGLAARVGINTGEVVVGDLATGLSGDPVAMAARLQQAAAADEVLVGETTRRLLGDTARVEPVATPVTDRRGRPADGWRLVGLVPGVPARAVAADYPLVGRAEEVARLRATFERTVREGRAHRITVIGEPGVGKSRLAVEFAASLGSRARVLSGRCPTYGEGVTFWPLREVVLQVAADRDDIAALLAGEKEAESVASQVAGAIGLTEEAGAGRELFAAVRRLFETLGSAQPVVVVVDDLHWAQPTFLDLLDYLAETVRAPVLVVCLTRPELPDQRGMGTSFVLEPLSQADSEQLVHDRLRGRVAPDELVVRVVTAAQGNPLFLEQLLAASRDEAELSIPPSVQALLAGRLDRLGPAERDLLRCASVVGLEFSVAALAAIVPEQAHRFVERHLRSLEGKELLRRTSAGFAFRHVLIQLAAYRGITRETRAELHERCAGWLEQTAGAELEELVGHHLEQACQQRRQAGLVDQATRELAVRAGERLARAGLRALGRYDMAAAGNLLSRARPLLPRDHPQRPQALRRLVAVCPALGWLSEADDVLEELLEDARERADARQEQHITLERLRVRMVAGPDPMPLNAIRDAAEQALEGFRGWADPVGMSEACYVLAAVHMRAGRMGDLEATADSGLHHAQRSGDAREQLGAPWWASLALVVGPTPVPEAIRRCQELLWVRETEHPGVLADLARLHAMLGNFDQARQFATRARWVVVERLRVRRSLAVVAYRTAEAEVLAGDPAAAERELRTALEITLAMGERDHAAQTAADLARVLAASGRRTEAATYAAVSREQAPAESVISGAMWRAATARTVGYPEAERLLREAVELVPPDMLNLRAGLHVELSDTLLATGQREAALDAAHEAAERYDRKGNLVGAGHAHALLTKLSTEGVAG
ncbi:MAG TPA: BTAD domain-containing putative transcriptional regulator [Jiangellaceae bacterium]|nr:BTAD domain-containing putative transcriptional regulator [Jiangellaceae bacterium]